LPSKQPTWPYDIESGPGGLTRMREGPSGCPLSLQADRLLRAAVDANRRSQMAVLLLRPPSTNIWKAVQRAIPELWAPEAIMWHDTPIDLPTEAARKKHHADMMLSMRFNYAIYANYYMGTLRPLNRMIKMANTEMVLVIPSDKGWKSVSSEWIQTAVAAFQMHPSLAMVGMEGFNGVAETGTMEFMHAIAFDRARGPIACSDAKVANRYDWVSILEPTPSRFSPGCGAPAFWRTNSYLFGLGLGLGLGLPRLPLRHTCTWAEGRRWACGCRAVHRAEERVPGSWAGGHLRLLS
jgi:hypothetical protein